MHFLILRILTHSELGMFHEYRRQGKEGSKQRAINFDWDVVDRVFPAAKDSDRIEMDLKYQTDGGVQTAHQWLKRQEKNWRLEGNCPKDSCYSFVEPGSLFAMTVDAGRSPAMGAWAVFAPEDPLTREVLALGESKGLARAAMAALHEDEADDTAAALWRAKPELFSEPTRKPQMKSAQSKSQDGGGGKRLPPNPGRLVQALAAVGHTMPAAVADLVDNAISADATRVDITFGRPDAGHGRWLSISDNGRGMTSEELDEAMRVGSDTDYEANSLGKFGYGLKGASWSQAKVFTVISKRAGCAENHLTWDTADMADWVAQDKPLDAWEKDVVKIDGQGTVVIWKNMRPPEAIPTARGLDPYSAEIMHLERHLALVFHRFIEGRAAGRKAVKLFINGNAVRANNPVGHPLARSYDAKTVRIPAGQSDGKVHVQAYLLPSEDELTRCHQAEGAEAVREALDRIGLFGKRNDTQGLFIYRHDRLIKWGGWHQMWETNDEKTKLARVIVDFDAVLDEPFKINVSKQIVQLPQQLQAEIKKLADAARKDSKKKYYHKSSKAPIAPAPPITGPDGARPVAPQAAHVGEPRLFPEPGFNSGGQPAVLSPPSRVSTKDVKTTKFVWKTITGLTGSTELQVSDLEPHLSSLVKHVSDDPKAIELLAAFLEALDEVGAQALLMAKSGK